MRLYENFHFTFYVWLLDLIANPDEEMPPILIRFFEKFLFTLKNNSQKSEMPFGNVFISVLKTIFKFYVMTRNHNWTLKIYDQFVKHPAFENFTCKRIIYHYNSNIHVVINIGVSELKFLLHIAKILRIFFFVEFKAL